MTKERTVRQNDKRGIAIAPRKKFTLENASNVWYNFFGNAMQGGHLMDISNASRFINSYNHIEAHLKLVYNARATQNFTDLVKRCADMDITVRRYESELIDYGKLRNAIVHRTDGGAGETVIAVPCDEVVRTIEFIEKLLCHPPRLIDAIKVKKVMSVFADKPALAAVEAFAASRQKTLLIYDHGTMLGAINTYLLYSKILKVAQSGQSVTDFLKDTLCRDLVDAEEMKRYLIMGSEATVFDVFVAFEEKRDLTAVIVTQNGIFGEKALSIITPSDFPRINRYLESYDAKPF